MPRAIGIDLGTVNSEAAVIEDGKPKIIKSAEGQPYFPSVVAFTEDGELLVGELAKRQAVMNPDATIQYIKRKMGTREKIKIRGKEYTPEQISAFILQKIKRDAEEYIGEEIKEAVITTPAYFNDSQRQATKIAGEIAGFEVRRIINEPTAAALSYGLDKEKGKVAVYDLGAGTFDITIMDIGGGVFEVLSTAGNTTLGGYDMDVALANYMASKFKEEYGIDLRKDAIAWNRLIEACEKAKIELSSMMQTVIDIPYIAYKENEPLHLHEKVRREEFERLIEPIVGKTLDICRKALKDAKIKAVEHLIFVGGTTRIPFVRQKAEEFFGIEAEKGVDPMECVAFGAAIQAGILSKELRKEVVLLDVIPLTLSVETLGGIATPIIKRNTTIPVRKSKIFTTAEDYQTSVKIHIVQGERAMAKDNKSLGNFHLTGIPAMPKGMARIEVTFDVDANGILHVSAKDLLTGKKQSIVIEGAMNLSKEEIEKMKEEARKYLEKDKKSIEIIKAKNEAYAVLNSVKKIMSQMGEEKVEKMRKIVEELKEAMEKNDVEKMKRKSNEIMLLIAENEGLL